MIVNGKAPITILDKEEIEKIKETSENVLEKIGCQINDEVTLDLLKKENFIVDENTGIVKFPKEKLYQYLSYVKKTDDFTLYGRDLNKKAEFGRGKTNIMSSSGQYMMYDFVLDERRNATRKDLNSIIKVSNHLENIDIVGSLVLPTDIDLKTRHLEQLIILLNNTDKPISYWINNAGEAKYQIEIMKIVRDGQGKLKDFPFCQCFIEAISPLKFTKESMEVLRIFAREGLPIGFGPMAMQGATSPSTVAGTIVQENAEILAGIVISQVINPGNPVIYWGIPHCMDLMTGNMSFSSPEQSLLAVSLVQIARSYGFYAVGVNEGLSDSNLIDDAQSGFERGISLINGLYSKADILAHQGICGQDSCGSVLQLIIDNEFLSFLKRYFNYFSINTDTLAEKVIYETGIKGNYLINQHTLDHFKNEIYVPGILNRDNWDSWAKKGRKSTKVRAMEKYSEIIKKDPIEPIDDYKMKMINEILKSIKEK